MQKISIEDLRAALDAAKIEPEKQQKVLEEIEELIESNKSHVTTQKLKNEFGVILYAPELVGKEYTASIYTIKEGDDHSTVLKRISESAKDQNDSAKRKKNLIGTVGQAFQYLKRSFIKAKGVNLKTKETVRVLISDNNLIN